jgi:serine/threonine-protein kinase
MKVLSAGWAKTADVTRRFRAEARAASAIGHPNIVEVLDADELPDGRPFIVMEHIKGRDLLAVLRAEPPLAWQRVCTIAARIAHALHAAHGIGIIHRDLKAENVMLVATPAGEIVKVLDFGVAVNIADGAERATRPGIAVGTPEYMAPEQARGDTPAPSFDIYALGVLMFELLVGEPPFTAANPLEILGRKAVSPAPKIASRRTDLPPEVAELVDECLAMDPADRPATAQELGERLDELAKSSNEVSRVVVADAIGTQRRGVEPWALALASAAVLGTAVVLIWPTEEPAPVVSAAKFEAPVVDTTPAPVLPPPAAPVPSAPVVEPEATPPEPAVDVAAVEPAGGKRRGKGKSRTLPGVAPDPTPPTESATDVGDSEACARERRAAEDARDNHDWHGVMRHTDMGKCWPVGSARKKLRVKANMELNRFEECVRLGKDSSDKEVIEWVRICNLRVDAKG